MIMTILRRTIITRTHSIAHSILILALLSWLSLTALGLINSLLWLYEGFLGVNEGLVISARGFSPLTALISRSEIEQKISSISNITIEYYLVTPILINNRVFVLRSINSSNLSINCLLISENIARELGVRVGDRLLASSIFTSEIYELEVCGYTSGYVFEAPYDLVLKIRGVSPGYYSYAIIRGPSEALSSVIKSLGVRPEESRLTGLIVAVFSRISSNETRVVFHRAITEAYITSFGLQRDYIVYFAYTIAVASILGSLIVGLDIVRRVKSVFKVFRLLGVSKRTIMIVVILLSVLTVFIAFILALLLYRYVEVFTLSVFNYTLKPRVEGELVLVVFSVLLILYILGLLIGVIREVE